MPLEFVKAHNGQLTCSFNNVFLHSKYDPNKEAQRFVDNIQINFTPLYIVVTEPALSYTATFLRNRFKSSKIFAIRFTKDFSEYNNLWDEVINFDESNPESLTKELLKLISEDDFTRTIFLSWKPSETAYTRQFSIVWEMIKRFILTSRDILGTKKFFNNRWLKNSINFCKDTTKTAIISKGDKPVLIVASGTSLQKLIKDIKKLRENFFLIAVSSALLPLIENEIYPDLCISTDGGYWAKKHLEVLIKNHITIPLAVPAESAIPAELFSKLTFIPLTYSDGPESILLNNCGIKTMSAKRNGTVSGTAAEFALSITSNFVGIIGLDLAETKGFSHTQPNSLELFNSAQDFKFRPSTTRFYLSETNIEPLEIYASWFKSRTNTFYSRFLRIVPENHNCKNLFPLKDINIIDFIKLCRKSNTPISFSSTSIQSKTDRILIIKNTLSELEKNLQNKVFFKDLDIWCEYLAYPEFILAKKYNDDAHTNDLISKSLKAIKKIQEKLCIRTMTSK